MSLNCFACSNSNVILEVDEPQRPTWRSNSANGSWYHTTPVSRYVFAQEAKLMKVRMETLKECSGVDDANVKEDIWIADKELEHDCSWARSDEVPDSRLSYALGSTKTMAAEKEKEKSHCTASLWQNWRRTRQLKR